MIFRNCRSTSSMPAAVQRSAISPVDQRFTLRWVRRTISSIDSHGFVLSSVRFSEPVTPSQVRVSVSSMPSRSELAAPGSCGRARRRAVGVGRGRACDRRASTPAQPELHLRTVPLGQMVEHVALLVPHVPVRVRRRRRCESPCAARWRRRSRTTVGRSEGKHRRSGTPPRPARRPFDRGVSLVGGLPDRPDLVGGHPAATRSPNTSPATTRG
jgi:hypothetical protein